MIPTMEECLDLMVTYRMRDNIRAHSIVVERVAREISRGLREAGVPLSLRKVAAGALMHDIAKTACLGTGSDHAAKGAEICLSHHFDEIAVIVGEHVRLRNYQPQGAICEKEVVYYADKRVNHDRIVSLEERLDYLLQRYGRNEARLRRLIGDNFELCKKVEKKLFARLSFRPEDLIGQVGG
jgi:putative nucleotidyltransferase with HDIG domain